MFSCRTVDGGKQFCAPVGVTIYRASSIPSGAWRGFRPPPHKIVVLLLAAFKTQPEKGTLKKMTPQKTVTLKKGTLPYGVPLPGALGYYRCPGDKADAGAAWSE